MLKNILIVVFVLIVALLMFATTKPDSIHVERSANINAPAQRIFPLIEDFHRWSEWSPYEKLDPAMQRTFGGAASGKGAIYEWQGNSNVGAGRMEIAESTAPARIGIDLRFLKPMEGSFVARFTLVPSGDGGTRVTWSMDGPAPFISKLMQVFIDIDKMTGKDFEQGLANLKAVVEGPATSEATPG